MTILVAVGSAWVSLLLLTIATSTDAGAFGMVSIVGPAVDFIGGRHYLGRNTVL